MPQLACPAKPPRLPRAGFDGQKICDELGNVWQFDITVDAWIYQGTVNVPVEVTEDNDGLVTSEIYQRIQYLRAATNSGLSIGPTLKILPNTNAYWYLFQSTDRLIRFSPESVSDLRIEVDRARLYRLFARLSCPGSRGLTGDVGDRGASGGPKTIEKYYVVGDDKSLSLNADGTQLSFDFPALLTPLETDISIRLFDHTPLPMSDDGAAIVITIAPSGDETTLIVVVSDGTISLAASVVNYDRSTTHLYGMLTLAAGSSWRDRPWCMRARQKGAVGDAGVNASCFLVTESRTLVSDVLSVACPIVQMRLGEQDQILSFCTNLFTDTCVSNLKIPLEATQIAPGSAAAGRMLAIRPELNVCNDLVAYQFGDTLTQPELQLPEWTPLAGCQDAAAGCSPCGDAPSVPASGFDWVSQTS